MKTLLALIASVALVSAQQVVTSFQFHWTDLRIVAPPKQFHIQLKNKHLEPYWL